MIIAGFRYYLNLSCHGAIATGGEHHPKRRPGRISGLVGQSDMPARPARLQDGRMKATNEAPNPIVSLIWCNSGIACLWCVAPEWRRRNHGTQMLGGSFSEWPTRQRKGGSASSGVSVVRQHPAVISETTARLALSRATAGKPAYKALSDRAESVAYRVDNRIDLRTRIGGKVPVLGDSEKPKRRYADAV